MLECVINLSEGRDERILTHLDAAAGPSLRDRHSDPVHHRSVFTLINGADALLPDVHHLINVALDILDLRDHDGVHPRLGVVDVVPFVALSPEVTATAMRLRDHTAQWVARTRGVPAFLYGPLAGGERTLPYVRAHAFRTLAPDYGPAAPDPRNGAVVVGAREILVAWNIWLSGVSLERAKLLAQLVRRPGVRTLGLPLGEHVQVSCNIVDYELAPPSQVYDQVVAHLPPGGRIDRCELVGLAPRRMLVREDPARWSQLGLSDAATIESRLGR